MDSPETPSHGPPPRRPRHGHTHTPHVSARWRGNCRLAEWPGGRSCDDRQGRGRARHARGRLILNDDGHVFLNLSDDLHKDDLRRYLQSYCRPGLDAVAYCVGDMTWPTLYPTQVGNQRGNSTPAASDQVRALLTLLPYLEYEIALKAN